MGVLYISAVIVHIHFQRICVTDIIMVVIRYISQFIREGRGMSSYIITEQSCFSHYMNCSAFHLYLDLQSSISHHWMFWDLWRVREVIIYYCDYNTYITAFIPLYHLYTFICTLYPYISLVLYFLYFQIR